MIHPVVEKVLKDVKERYENEPEFLQAVEEVLPSLSDYVAANPDVEKYKILESIVEPDSAHMFRVQWTDDRGETHVNRGYRIQFNGTLGPYKGGIRFHPSVSPSVLKFLGFEQIFKNSLTGLSLGGAKGGADFDPKGKSTAEVARFCRAFMQQLAPYIGEDTDVPAGDLGCGGREIGFMFGAYRQQARAFTGVLTGKGVEWGGSKLRTEATGYGVVYFARHMLERVGKDIRDIKAAVSGAGNVALFCCEKLLKLGATVMSVSDSGGVLWFPDGMTRADLKAIMRLKNERRGRLKDYDGPEEGDEDIEEDEEDENEEEERGGAKGEEAKGMGGFSLPFLGGGGEKEGAKSPSTSPGGSGEKGKGNKGGAKFEYKDKATPWEQSGFDFAFPCATQNELDGDDAKKMVEGGLIGLVEGANMPCKPEAIAIFRGEADDDGKAKEGKGKEDKGKDDDESKGKSKGKGEKILYAPGKAANAGGVAVSGLEMAQNASKDQWSRKEVDRRLREIMKHIHEACVEHGEEDVDEEEKAGKGDGEKEEEGDDDEDKGKDKSKDDGKGKKKGGKKKRRTGQDAPWVDYMKGANVAGFKRVSEAMVATGSWAG